MATAALLLPAVLPLQRALARQPEPSRTLAPIRRRIPARHPATKILHLLTRPGIGALLTCLILGFSGTAGFVESGKYAEFVEANGALTDIVARNIGFPIEAINVTTDNGLQANEVLPVTGITANSSLLFLSAAAVRDKIMALPIVQEASVRKLFPNRLLIHIVERKPAAIWQKDGVLSIISADGTPIAVMENDRFAMLPFVVGEGANLHAQDFIKLMDGAQDLKSRIRAGTLVSGRRWDLKMSNGIDVHLPERQPEAALAMLSRMEQASHILEKDVLALDFRVPGRVIARLSEEAVASRQAALIGKKAKRKVGRS